MNLLNAVTRLFNTNRLHAWLMIREGQVTVNGKVELSQFAEVTENDVVRLR